MQNRIVVETPKPGIGPLRPREPHREVGGFQALEGWLYDLDYVDLERSRAGFLAARVRKPARRAVPHTPPGAPIVRQVGSPTRVIEHEPSAIPTLVRDVGLRRIHIATSAPQVMRRAELIGM